MKRKVTGWGGRAVVRSLLIAGGLGLIVAAWSSQAQPAAAQDVPSDFGAFVIEEDVAAPVSLGMAPDGRLIVLTDSGRALMVKNDQVLPTPVFDIRDKVDTSGSQGLQSIAFDNNFEENGYIYVTYTFDTSGDTRDSLGQNRLVRFTMVGDVATDETLLFNDFPSGDNITLHYGGAVEVGTDGKIYTTVGDYLLGPNSQNLNNVQGTVLRLNKDGSIPTDNPFYDELEGPNRAIYAYGLRNPFQTALRPSDGEIFISDVGGNLFEELNVLERGANYGWRLAEGPRDPNNPAHNDFVDPLWAYRHIDNFPNDPLAGCAIIGGSFYETANPTFPSRFHDQYFTGDFCTGNVYVVDPDTGAAEVFAETAGFGLVDMAVSPTTGELFYIHQAFRGDQAFPAGGIGKISFVGEQEQVLITSQPGDVSIAVGGDASFFVGATGNGDLTYQWTRNGVNIEGESSPRLTVSNVQDSDNNDQFAVQITNVDGAVTSRSATLSITDNTVPVPSITITGVGPDGYEAGREFSFSGSAIDAEDGELPASALTWDIRLNHDDHDHELTTALGASGTVTVPPDIETSTNVWITLYLTATDSDGTASTASQRVDPHIVDVTLASDPEGLDVTLEGQDRAAPFTFDSVVGVRREIGAPGAQTRDGDTFTFTSWSDGSARNEPRITPSSDTTLTCLLYTSPSPRDS